MIDTLTPCVSQCKLNDKNICKGCGRTLEQVRDWRIYSDTKKRQIIRELASQTSK